MIETPSPVSTITSSQIYTLPGKEVVPEVDIKVLCCSIQFRVYLDDIEKIIKTIIVNLPNTNKTGQQYSQMFEEEINSLINRESIKGVLWHPLNWYGFYSAIRNPDRTDIVPSEWNKFKRLLWHRKSKSAVVQIVFGINMDPFDIRPPYERVVIKEKVEKPIATPKVIISARAPKGRTTSTTQLLGS